MNKKDKEIEAKLREIEASVLKEQEEAKAQLPAAAEKHSTELTAHASTDKDKNLPAEISLQNDLYYFSGIGLLLTGLFMLFNQVRVATPMMTLFGFGGQGGGLILLPLLIGVGWLIYDSKNRIAWFLSAASCALIFVSVLNSMILFFPQMTLLGTVMMLLPFAVGAGLLLKGMGGAKGIQDKMKK